MLTTFIVAVVTLIWAGMSLQEFIQEKKFSHIFWFCAFLGLGLYAMISLVGETSKRTPVGHYAV